MSLLSPHVAAFIAVIEESSFEKAAKRLSVTPSAVSQRIKLLEDRVGQLLVIRQTPCRATPAGEQLLSRVKPMALLEAEVMREFLPDQEASPHANMLAIAVNEDSLSTWLLPALAKLHGTYNHSFDISVDDQDFTLEQLKSGNVIGALTSEKKPLQGCMVHALGNMRYCAIASPQFAQQYFPNGLTAEAFAQAPMLIYNRKDPLQIRFAQNMVGKTVRPRKVHYLPNSIQLVAAATQHMGWCMAAEGLFDRELAQGSIVNIAPNQWLEEPLYWQHAAVRSKVLCQITEVFYAQAGKTLYR